MNENSLIISNDNFANSIDALEKIMVFSEKISKSSVIPYRLKGKPSDIAVILLYGREMELSPMQALTEVYVVNGIPAIGGKIMLSRIYKYAPNVYMKWRAKNSKEVTLEMARDKKDITGAYTAHWTIEKATNRGLIKKDNWKNNPEMMMTWRCISECARVIFPDIIMGYLPEEIEEIKTDEEINHDLAETHNKVKDSFVEITNKFAGPEEVISFSDKKEMPADPNIAIKLKIENRDWKINMGSDKGRHLHEFTIDDLESRLKNLSNTIAEKRKANPNFKLPDDISVLMQNITAYCDKYRQLEKEINEENTND